MELRSSPLQYVGDTMIPTRMLQQTLDGSLFRGGFKVEFKGNNREIVQQPQEHCKYQNVSLIYS